MKCSRVFCLLILLSTLAVNADEKSATPIYPELIFEDDFSEDAFGKRWGHYKSASIVEDGVLVGKTADIKDHAGVDHIRCEGRRDMEVALRFKFAGPEAKKFNVWFDDKAYKGSHAGHITSIFIHPGGGSIADAKRGHMSNALYKMRKETGTLDDAGKAILKTTMISFKKEIVEGEWHDLLIRTEGPLVTVYVDGEEVCRLESEGNAHATKSLISLTTNINDVHYDDLVIRAAPLADGAE
ncbi:family 16 glycoside hydrolase [Verrucomicrobiales bacterium BCK34]|nr:family 16 glycoside hydrolase [Verrucomicrobiales bacterium BCK34]